jgi:hypothetical protein
MRKFQRLVNNALECAFMDTCLVLLDRYLKKLQDQELRVLLNMPFFDKFIFKCFTCGFEVQKAVHADLKFRV